jgi:hypothetical protein
MFWLKKKLKCDVEVQVVVTVWTPAGSGLLRNRKSTNHPPFICCRQGATVRVDRLCICRVSGEGDRETIRSAQLAERVRELLVPPDVVGRCDVETIVGMRPAG